ncbi:MAG TPA: SDR family oxidoreductase [Polyangiaceae bacterium]|nr:SDR family oxidoreductase [Polyangiaceae bacterium]
MEGKVTTRKVAIITGGASGIGRALAEELAARDMELVIADRQAELAQEIVHALRQRGASAYVAEADVRSFESLQHLVESTVARSGRIDYFFNNAGIGAAGPMESYSLQDWNEVFDVNLRGVAHGVQAVYPRMIAQGFGHIINTASVAGLIAFPGAGSYTASKFGVVALSRALRVEAAHHGIRVSVLCPGLVRTPILSGGRYGRVNAGAMSEDARARSVERLRPMPPEVFARKALRAVMRDRAVIVIPSWWKLAWYLERLAPDLSLWLAGRAFARMRREMTPTSEG